MESFLNRQSSVKITLVGILLIRIFLVGYFSITWFSPQPSTEEPSYEEALRKNVMGEDPGALQDFLVEKLKEGKKDDETLSAIYWVTHRFFDNDGDIYEIYDFINSHAEVAFLREAELLYPDIFEKIKTTRVEKYSYESHIALLAYYEIIDKYDYASIAVWGIAANKYSEIALRGLPRSNDTPEVAKARQEYANFVADRATDFATKARFFVINNTMQTGALDELRNTGDTDADLLVGLNQYASALLNLKGFGIEMETEFTPIELFEFNSQLARTYVPRLYFFTNYLYASALVYGNMATPEAVAIPLGRVVEYADANLADGWRVAGSINRAVNSKDSNELGLYEYTTTKKLAALDPNFKSWLMRSGWEETDF